VEDGSRTPGRCCRCDAVLVFEMTASSTGVGFDVEGRRAKGTRGVTAYLTMGPLGDTDDSVRVSVGL